MGEWVNGWGRAGATGGRRQWTPAGVSSQRVRRGRDRDRNGYRERETDQTREGGWEGGKEKRTRVDWEG